MSDICSDICSKLIELVEKKYGKSESVLKIYNETLKECVERCKS